MWYNHELHLFAQKYPHKFSPKDRKTILERDIEYWKSENTFSRMFALYLQMNTTRYNLDGTILRAAQPFEDLASIDETLPQHYSASTAALDWTLNYNVAIYFALSEKKITAQYLAIYALKIHKPDHAPIHIINKSIYVKNIRAERQEGTFSYFTNPFSFYFQLGHFPSINFFHQFYMYNLNKSSFELKELLICIILQNPTTNSDPKRPPNPIQSDR